MEVVRFVHHIKMKTKSQIILNDYLTESFNFYSLGCYKQNVALKSGSAIFVTQPATDDIDTVYDIALEVDNIEDLLKRALQRGTEIIKSHKIIKDIYGSFEVARIKSCVGNLVHTVICSDKYSGQFLPQYSTSAYSINDSCSVRKFDHITIAVPSGSSDSIIQWYNDVFRMGRIKINSDDSLTEGFVVEHNGGGMLLKAFDYWKCSEIGIINEDRSCKFILAEELNDKVPNQIGTFLKEHEGPGIHHVALSVDDIEASARKFHFKGAKFLIHPKRYYEMMHKRLPTKELNLSLLELERYGILVDTESSTLNEEDSKALRYLLQAFTRPIFDRNTFFLELIERHGAKGFGSGNIKALWDAVNSDLICEQSGAGKEPDIEISKPNTSDLLLTCPLIRLQSGITDDSNKT